MNPMFAEVEQPGIGTDLMPESPLAFSAAGRLAPARAPLLGEHTDEPRGIRTLADLMTNLDHERSAARTDRDACA